MDDRDKFDPKRALRLVNSDKILTKVWNKVPNHYDKDNALESIFKSLIRTSNDLMTKYRKTYDDV